jgi:tetratricopeptide (TPR) repeat protein
MLGAVWRHLGAPLASLALLDRARRLCATPAGKERVPDAPLTELFQHLALTEQQLCHFGAADRAATRGIEIARRARLRGALYKAYGCAGLVALARGRADRAVEHHPQSVRRSYGYLVDALGRAGAIVEARTCFDEAMRLAPRSRDAAGSEEAWLRMALGSALVAHGAVDDARRILEAPAVERAIAAEPLPGLLLRRALGVARRDARGLDLLAGSPVAYGRELLPHLAFAAHVNVLVEARARVATGALDADATARARFALGAIPSYGDASAFFGPSVRRVEAALDRGMPAALGLPLDALLARATRLV